jgi:hypothetical protein
LKSTLKRNDGPADDARKRPAERLIGFDFSLEIGDELLDRNDLVDAISVLPAEHQSLVYVPFVGID